MHSDILYSLMLNKNDHYSYQFYQPLMCRRFTVWRTEKPSEIWHVSKAQLRPRTAHCYPQIHLIKAKLCHLTHNNQIFVKVFMTELYVEDNIISLWEDIFLFSKLLLSKFLEKYIINKVDHNMAKTLFFSYITFQEGRMEGQ